MKRITLMFLSLMFGAVMLSGCESNDGPLEEAGEKVDEAMTDAGNAIEDACEDIKEGAGAEDKDC